MRSRAATAAILLVAAPACALGYLSAEFSTDAGSDAGSDAGIAIDGASTKFCESRTPTPSFCDDFEGDAGFERWDDVTQLFGGTATIDTRDPSSPASPSSLFVTVPEADADAPIAYLKKKFLPAFVSEATLAFAIRTEDMAGKTERAPVATIHAEVPGGPREVRLVLAAPPNIAELHLGSQGEVQLGRTYFLSPALKPGAWTRVEMQLSLTSPGHVKVTLDGVLALDQELSGTWQPAPVSINVGIEYAVTPTRAFTVRLDDVAFDAK